MQNNYSHMLDRFQSGGGGGGETVEIRVGFKA